MRRTRVLWGLLLCAILVAVAGGVWLARPGGDDGGGQQAAVAGAPEAVTPGQVASFPSYQIPQDQLAGWLDAATDAEKAAIEDGVLTFAEYSALVLATVRCIDDADSDGGPPIAAAHSVGYGRGGPTELGPRLSSHGVYSYHAEITTGSPVRPEAAFAKVNACKAGSAQVEHLWAQHTAPHEPELLAMRNHMAECLRQAGVPMIADPSDLELRRAKEMGLVSREAYQACQFAAADAFEIDRLPG